ncbi:MAG: hypothetical protein HDR18_00750 [Lachnospiraceae bacterium]|nr:hypothetical protein [Lachnospiraceae bacterium]MBD5515234.1 hypothetical protein [Lachnospiraceae bacterium]
MDNLMEKALHSMIHKQFVTWNAQNAAISEIERGLLCGCSEADSAEKIYARMVINSMEVAAEISAKIILEILLTAGVFEAADERQLKKLIFSIVQEQVPESDINGDIKED